MDKHQKAALDRVIALGVSYEDACALRRISLTLHSWFIGECGDSDEFSATVIVRGRKEKGQFIYDETGTPFRERQIYRINKTIYIPIPDRERGAMKRLNKIMEKYSHLTYFIQTDPRGAALYIIPRASITEGMKGLIDCYYSSIGYVLF